MSFFQPHLLSEAYQAVYEPQEQNEYSLIVDYLVSEGYAETVEEAEDLIEELSDEDIDYILEGFKPTNYTTGNIFNDRTKTAKRIDDQIKKLRASGKGTQAMSVDFINRMQDTPEGRAEVRQISNTNKNKPKERAKSDAMRHMKQTGFAEDIDTYDLVLDYLLDEGYAETSEDAVHIMANMSEEWVDEILDEANRAEKEFKLNEPEKLAARNTSSAYYRFSPKDPNSPGRFRAKGALHAADQQKRREIHKAKRGVKK